MESEIRNKYGYYEGEFENKYEITTGRKLGLNKNSLVFLHIDCRYNRIKECETDCISPLCKTHCELTCAINGVDINDDNVYYRIMSFLEFDKLKKTKYVIEKILERLKNKKEFNPKWIIDVSKRDYFSILQIEGIKNICINYKLGIN